MGQATIHGEQLLANRTAAKSDEGSSDARLRGEVNQVAAIRRSVSSRLQAATGEHTLTRRERDVLYLVAWGMSNAEIGDALEISARTVEIHRSNMLQKLGAHNSADAVRIAMSGHLRDFICQ